MRHDLVYLIHKALRTLASEILVNFQQTDFTDKIQVEVLFQDLKMLESLYHGHAEIENTMILSELEKKGIDVSKYKDDHAEDDLLGHLLLDKITAFEDASNDHKQKAWSELFQSLISFVSFNFSHMQKEETELNQILWSELSDAELLAIEQKVVMNTPPDKMMNYMVWFLKALSNKDLIKWLGSVKKSAPEPVFQNIVLLGIKHVPAERWSVIYSAL